MLVGCGGEEHIGAHLHRAAQEFRVPVCFADTRAALNGSLLTRRINWWLRGHRPNRLRQFSQDVLDKCRQFRPDLLIATGLAPLTAAALHTIGNMGIQRLNFLTDDPWNPAHQAPWFMEGLGYYDWVFSPRKANLDDLRKYGCPRVSYLPFGYAKHIHYPEAPSSPEKQREVSGDVIFAGGADRDRVKWITALIKSGHRVCLYGSYWDRYPETGRVAKGNADGATLRQAMAASKVALTLVRKANRDGHSMRSFEVPAMRACMVVEKTDDHLDLFGPEGSAVLYFQTIPEMLDKVDWLLSRPEERWRLADAANRLVIDGRHSYHDRLKAIIATVAPERALA